jgi:hypothetical protein
MLLKVKKERKRIAVSKIKGLFEYRHWTTERKVRACRKARKAIARWIGVT